MKIIGYDLGTGGIKTSLWDEDGELGARVFLPYDTLYPHAGWHEQRPRDWWEAVCHSTRMILDESGASPAEIAGVALSGHSMVAVPLDAAGEVLTPSVPIWSDMRAEDCVSNFFSTLSRDEWYMTTGNGDPPACYAILKMMWLKRHHYEIFNRTSRVVGSKDYINYLLTGTICTDPSYASGFGVFRLAEWRYEDAFFEAAGVPRQIFPEILPSDAIIGRVTGEAARRTGLREGTPVACGGVDNSLMALGARGLTDGGIYTSLGSSAWIAITSREPVLDPRTLPFVFAHVARGYYTSAVSIFSAGGSLRWAREQLCRDVPSGEDGYALVDQMAAGVPVGSGGVIFNPTLAGGSAQEASPRMRGGFAGITLATTREDMVRATMEGVAMALRATAGVLAAHVDLGHEMLVCGGGSKSALWRQIFADVFDVDIVKTTIDQNAASLGAAALAAKAVGLWSDYSPIERIHRREAIVVPIEENVRRYRELQKLFAIYTRQGAELAEKTTI